MSICYGAVIVLGLVGCLFSGEPSFRELIAAGDACGVQRLLERNPEDANAVIEMTPKGSDPYLLSVLCYALQHRQPEIAEMLLEAGTDPMQNVGFRSPLGFAALEGYTTLIPLLAEKGDNPNSFCEYGYSPLGLAKDVRTAQLLLDCGAEVNARNDNGQTALHFRASFGDVDVAAFLIEHGADVNAKDNAGFVPLHQAAFETVRLLIDQGADVNARDSQGRNPLVYVLERQTESPFRLGRPSFYQTLRLLIDASSEADAGALAYAGDLSRLKAIIADRPELIHTYRYRREPLLIIAVKEGHTEIADYLIEKGADLSAAGRLGDSAIHLAALAGNSRMVELLLKAGLDANARGPGGELPLHWVSVFANEGSYQRQCDYEETAWVLLDAGSELNACAVVPRNPLSNGTKYIASVDQITPHLKSIEIRKSQRPVQTAVPTAVAFDAGDTPLHSAARWGRTEIVRMLINAGAEVNAANALNQTPLHYAVTFQHTEAVRALLAAGADISIKTQNGLTAVEIAETIEDAELLSLLTAEER